MEEQFKPILQVLKEIQNIVNASNIIQYIRDVFLVWMLKKNYYTGKWSWKKILHIIDAIELEKSTRFLELFYSENIVELPPLLNQKDINFLTLRQMMQENTMVSKYILLSLIYRMNIFDGYAFLYKESNIHQKIFKTFMNL